MTEIVEVLFTIGACAYPGDPLGEVLCRETYGVATSLIMLAFGFAVFIGCFAISKLERGELHQPLPE